VDADPHRELSDSYQRLSAHIAFVRKDKMPRRRTLRERIVGRIARRQGDAREFRDLGGEDQVLRALRDLMREGQLVRLGYGVYGRAEIFVSLRRFWRRVGDLSTRRGRRSTSSVCNGSRLNSSAPTMKAVRPKCRSILPCV
jgi:hypothetical protein